MELVVIGTSAGGVHALSVILSALPADYSTPTAVVQHVRGDSSTRIASLLDSNAAVRVTEARDKEMMKPGTVYIAPSGFHLYVERDLSFSFTLEPPENYSRPSIDVLFESAAHARGPSTMGILLTGANSDGALGLLAIKQKGGVAVIQDPATAEVPTMPESAARLMKVDHTLSLEYIGELLGALNQERVNSG